MLRSAARWSSGSTHLWRLKRKVRAYREYSISDGCGESSYLKRPTFAARHRDLLAFPLGEGFAEYMLAERKKWHQYMIDALGFDVAAEDDIICIYGATQVSIRTLDRMRRLSRWQRDGLEFPAPSGEPCCSSEKPSLTDDNIDTPEVPPKSLLRKGKKKEPDYKMTFVRYIKMRRRGGLVADALKKASRALIDALEPPSPFEKVRHTSWCKRILHTNKTINT